MQTLHFHLNLMKSMKKGVLSCFHFILKQINSDNKKITNSCTSLMVVFFPPKFKRFKVKYPDLNKKN